MEYKKIRHNGKRPGMMVYFSDVYKNLLIIEVIEKDENSGLTHDEH